MSLLANLGAFQPCGNCGSNTCVSQVTPDARWMYADVLFVCPRCAHGEWVQVAYQLLAQSGLWTPESEPEKPPAPEPEQVIEGSVIGFRAWRIRDWLLTGTGVSRSWHPGVNEATCDSGDENMKWAAYTRGHGTHPAPAIGCHCGITALARFAKTDDHWASADVYGAIEAWSDETVSPVHPGDVAAAAGVEVKGDHDDHQDHGRFILHGTGFRAQYGKVVLLTIEEDWPTAKKAAVRALAREHEADVCKQAHLEDAAKEHGQLIPDELLEWAKEGDPGPDAAVGGYLQQAVSWVTPQYRAYTYSSSQWLSTVTPPKPKPGPKGICQTLGYPGPPNHGKFRRGDRVRDRKGEIWLCVKGGQPGYWEQEEAAE